MNQLDGGEQQGRRDKGTRVVKPSKQDGWRKLRVAYVLALPTLFLKVATLVSVAFTRRPSCMCFLIVLRRLAVNRPRTRGQQAVVVCDVVCDTRMFCVSMECGDCARC